MSSFLVQGLGRAEVPAAPDKGPRLPDGYGVTRLVLMPRDAEWMHAYWEVRPGDWTELERRVGPGRTVLRFIAASGKPLGDVVVRPEAGSRYVRLDCSGRRVRAELGLVLTDGRFVVVASSPEVLVPSGSAGGAPSVRWVSLRGRAFAPSVGGPAAPVSLPRPPRPGVVPGGPWSPYGVLGASWGRPPERGEEEEAAA